MQFITDFRKIKDEKKINFIASMRATENVRRMEAINEKAGQTIVPIAYALQSCLIKGLSASALKTIATEIIALLPSNKYAKALYSLI